MRLACDLARPCLQLGLDPWVGELSGVWSPTPTQSRRETHNHEFEKHSNLTPKSMSYKLRRAEALAIAADACGRLFPCS